MNISEYPGGRITVSQEGESIELEGGIYYHVFGEGLNLVDFVPKLAAISKDTRNILGNIAARITLIDHLDSLNDLDIASLQLYLLCTCIDTLANPTWLPFNNWIITRKEKYRITERNALLESLNYNSNELAGTTHILSTVQKLYGFYLTHHGTSRKFGDFFLKLPESFKHFIADSYQVFKSGENCFDPDVHQNWIKKEVDERLLKIAEYLYNYRRNDFTHASKTYSTTWSRSYKTPEEMNREQEREGRYVTHLTFFKDNDPDKEVKLTVLVGRNEISVLRTAIVYHCRALIGFADDARFLDKHIQRRRHLQILRHIVDEIEENWRIYKYYSMEWMAYEDHNDRYYGLPEFRWEWLQAVQEIPLESYGVISDSLLLDLRTCISRLKAINHPIHQLNEDYPPLYIRERRDDLQGVPENEQEKLKQKVELFKTLHAMYEFRDVRWHLAQLSGTFAEMTATVPDQGGMQIYSTSRPNYRAWV